MNASEKANQLVEEYEVLLSGATTWNKTHNHLFTKELAMRTVEEIQDYCGSETFYRRCEDRIRLGVRVNSYWDRVKHFIRLHEREVVKKPVLSDK